MNLPKIEDFDKTQLVQQEVIENTPSTFISTLPRFYTELQTTWDEGEQITDTKGNIISRTFKELEFEDNANLFIFEDTGFGDTVEDRYIYRVHLPFTETEYYSADNTLYDSFHRWTEATNGFFQEIIYRHKIIAQPRWDRPIDYSSATTGTCPIGDVDPTPTDTGKDEYTFVAVPPAEYPEVIPPLDEFQGGYCFRYENLSIPFVLNLDVGKALGAVVNSDGAFTLELGDGTTFESVTNGVELNPLLLVKQQLRITFPNPDQNLPTFVQVDLYGEEFQRGYLPSNLDFEPENIHHPSGTLLATRLQPPNKSFPDNFWNNIPTINELEDYNTRQLQEPGVLT